MSDGASFDAMYRAHAPSAFRRARRLLGSESDAHEVVQDVFLSLFEDPAQYGGKSALSTFLYSAVTHACLNRIRNQKTRLRLLKENLPPVKDEPMDFRLTPEQLSHLHRLLRDMPEPLGTVTVHYYVDDLSHDDIAKILGCSRRHVGDLLERVTKWAEAQEATPC